MYSDIVLFEGEGFALGFGKVIRTKILQGIKEARKEGLAVFECDESSIQNILESKKADIVILNEKMPKDHLHYRKTALNQVMCKLAKGNGTAIGFSLGNILSAKDRPLVMGRIMQSVRLCRKYKVGMVFASFAEDKYGTRGFSEMLALAHALGMSPGEASNALELAGKLLESKKVRKGAKGVMIVD